MALDSSGSLNGSEIGRVKLTWHCTLVSAESSSVALEVASADHVELASPMVDVNDVVKV